MTLRRFSCASGLVALATLAGCDNAEMKPTSTAPSTTATTAPTTAPAVVKPTTPAPESKPEMKPGDVKPEMKADTKPAMTPDTKPEMKPESPKGAASTAPAKPLDIAGAKLSPEEIANIKKLPEADQKLAMDQKLCPVSADHLGSMETPIKVTLSGKPVMLCCAGCKKDAEAAPDATLAKLAVPH